MSTGDDVFLATGLALEDVAESLAKVLDMQMSPGDRGDFWLAQEDFADLPGITQARLQTNRYSASDLYPDEVAVFDGCDTVFTVRRPDKDLNRQAKAAREAMRRLVDIHSWRAVLVHNLALLIATWDPERGWREYPAGTTPDIEDRHLWGAEV